MNKQGMEIIHSTYLGFENAVRSSEIVGGLRGLGNGFCDIVFGGRDTCIGHHLKAGGWGRGD